MRAALNISRLVVLLGILFYISCKRELSCESCADEKKNKPPIAKAGVDQRVTLPLDSIALDGSGSADPDGTIVSYKWSKISGPSSASILRSDSSKTVVKSLTMGVYQFELAVKDNGGLPAKDTVQVIVDDPTQPNRPPIAKAGADQTITLPITTVNLDGSGSTDPDNNITSYAWTKISGPTSFTIATLTAVQTQVNNLVQGNYQFELKVIDAGGLFAKDTMQITINTASTDTCMSNRPLINAQLIPFKTLSISRSDIAVGAAGNKIVFAGGTDGSGPVSAVDIYDISTNSWSSTQLSAPRFQIAVATSGNKIFFAGGYFQNGSWAYLCKDVDIYDVSTNVWSVDSLSVPRSGLAAAAVGDKVLFAGGTTANWEIDYSNVVDIFNKTTGTWSATTLSQGRGYLSAVTVGNKIYFAGGDKGLAMPTNRIDVFDNTTGSWSISTLSEPMKGPTGIAFGNKLYWAGGYNSFSVANGWNSSSQVEIKDANTQMSTLTCLHHPNNWYYHPNAAVERNNKIVFFTGNRLPYNKFDIYDSATSAWSIGILPVEIIRAAIISVNNIIYVAAGNQVWKLDF